MVEKSNVLIILNLLAVTLSIVVIYQTKASPEGIFLSFIILLILGLVDYLILRGAETLVKSIQYKRQKTLICPKCYTVIQKGERYCPNCGNSI